ncbi:hypothetical protein ERO13_D08G106233v2, partial [Gossypium hirsutum]
SSSLFISIKNLILAFRFFTLFKVISFASSFFFSDLLSPFQQRSLIFSVSFSFALCLVAEKIEAGNRLVEPPSSVAEVIPFLDVDEEPAIRTNTTILLGNIASYLNEGMGHEFLNS